MCAFHRRVIINLLDIDREKIGKDAKLKRNTFSKYFQKTAEEPSMALQYILMQSSFAMRFCHMCAEANINICIIAQKAHGQTHNYKAL